MGGDGLARLGFEDVLLYFRRSEDNERGVSDYHGVGGRLEVSDCRSMHPLVEACIEAGVNARIPAPDDHNDPTREGAGSFQSRSETADGAARPRRTCVRA